MPKRANRKKKGQARQRATKLATARGERPHSATPRIDYLAVRATMFRLHAIDKVISYAGVVALLILQLTVSKNFVDSHPNANTVIYAGFISLAVFIISAHSILSILGRKHPRTMTEQWMKRWFAWKMVISILMLTTCVFLIIYVLGVVDAISAFISVHWSSASILVVNTFSTILSLMLSGIIGNFAYDLLKRIVLRRKKD
jgi:hypothetical protein